MDLQKEKASASQHYVGWKASKRPCFFQSQRESFLLTLPFIERGYLVSVAVNGREAVEAAQREDFAVILMDIQMPEMDGFEATAAIREKELGTARHTPIVAMTAHALKGDEDRCLEHGMDAYISKPIRSSQRYELLERLLDSREEKDSTAVATPGDTSALT